VWRWSRWHPDTASAHTLGLEGRRCTNWTYDWAAVDAQGHKLPKGTYTLQVTFLAKELTAQRLASYSFDIT
jgi:hypothetical protein